MAKNTEGTGERRRRRARTLGLMGLNRFPLEIRQVVASAHDVLLLELACVSSYYDPDPH